MKKEKETTKDSVKEPWYLDKYVLSILTIVNFPILNLYGEYVISREIPQFLQFLCTVIIIFYITLILSLIVKKILWNHNKEEDDSEE